MFHGLYEQVVRFASEAQLAEELQEAKAEFLHRTGDLFESDGAFERRIAAFLEWYVLDRPAKAAGGKRPVDVYIEKKAAELAGANQEELARVQGFAVTRPSLFEFKRAKDEQMSLVDLLDTNKKTAKVQVYERRKPAGLESGDILEARLVPYDGKLMFSEAIQVLPREGRKVIVKVCKRYRTEMAETMPRVNLVHRVAFFANRCERYKHVAVAKIFADLVDTAFDAEPPVSHLRAASNA
ncbi:MAG: hypothetical protein ACAI38_24020 [Myxococcota bacterium]